MCTAGYSPGMWEKRKPLLIGLALVLCGSVVAGIVIGKVFAPHNDGEAVQRVRQLGTEAVARYEAQFVPNADKTARSGSTAATDLFDRLAQSIEQVVAEDRYQHALTLQGEKQWSEWTGDEIEALAAFLGEFASLLDDIRALAAIGEPVYHPDLSRGMGTELPHLAPLRTMARLLRFEAEIRAHSGNLEGAIENYHAILELAETLAEEPIGFSQLVREALNRIAFESMGSAFPAGGIPLEQARSFVKRTEGIYHREGWANALAHEAMLALNSVSTDPFVSVLSDELFAVIPETNATVLTLLYPSPFGEMIVNADRETCAEFLDRIIHAAHKPYYEARVELNAIEAELATLSFSFLKGYTKALVPQFSWAQVVQARNEAVLDLMRVGLVLEAHYAESGSYPASLDAVAGGLGGSIAVDPFTGRPYVYRPEGDTFTLYSLGVNQQDDGGRHDYRDGDIVWRGVAVRE